MVDFFNSIVENYGHFFSWQEVVDTMTSPESWSIIAILVLLEGLLSADNALVLAVMVKHLPKEQQKRALFYGILGAYVFRFIAIGLGTILVKITWIKVAGALYLLYIAYSGIFKKKGEEGETKNKGYGFWRTVLMVELMDIAFSIDSVIAAFGVSEEVWVLFVGGLLGVLMMRGVAQVFLKLIDKFPELETTAFIMIAIIAAKMLAAALFHFEVDHFIFFGILVVVFGGTILLSSMKRKREGKQGA
ncbi:YkoY family integral membrane protein [Paenibacillus harenae]|uniref:YkoY family integral membrane protein n=1 Tax=Paenibacillus harenae TaxID=306543 RepID=A0ABT9U181_PAEHA|nr:YkoY family integral membrane protein [Paenibacillus harenae]MDQ0113405.1 YkoY family integral membrane protein [Paenibacillus harenae]